MSNFITKETINRLLKDVRNIIKNPFYSQLSVFEKILYGFKKFINKKKVK